MRTVKALPFVTFLLITACGGGSGGGNDAIVQPSGMTNSPLVGEWQTLGCEIDQDGAFSGDTTHIYNDDFTGFRIISTYTGSTCEEPAFDLISSFTYRIGDSIEIPGRGFQTEIDFFYEEPLLTLNSQIAVDNFNALAFCNFTEWELGTTFEIPGCMAGLTTAVSSEPQFDIFLIENDEFLYGGTELSFTAENRPTQLNSSPSIWRVHAAESGEPPAYPQSVEGVWQLEGTNSFLRFAEDGSWISIFPDFERNCHTVDTVTLQAIGNDTYRGVTGMTLELIPGLGSLTVIFETSPTEFLLLPVPRIEIAFLDYCPN